MDKQIHTPGPWRFVENKSVDHPCNQGEQIAFIQTDKTCLDVSCVKSEDVSTEEFEANARLIASAPDLLSAINALLHLSEVYISNPNRFTAIAQAKKAIDKAINPDYKPDNLR